MGIVWGLRTRPDGPSAVSRGMRTTSAAAVIGMQTTPAARIGQNEAQGRADADDTRARARMLPEVQAATS